MSTDGPARSGRRRRLPPDLAKGAGMHAEGWYLDPYGVHEARWISDGTPTALVRDGHVEAHDPPPDARYEGPLRPVAEQAPADGEDLRRADDAEAAGRRPAGRLRRHEQDGDALHQLSGGAPADRSSGGRRARAAQPGGRPGGGRRRWPPARRAGTGPGARSGWDGPHHGPGQGHVVVAADPGPGPAEGRPEGPQPHDGHHAVGRTGPPSRPGSTRRPAARRGPARPRWPWPGRPGW